MEFIVSVIKLICMYVVVTSAFIIWAVILEGLNSLVGRLIGRVRKITGETQNDTY